MDTYIQTRGTDHSQGFSWWNITEKSEKPAEPNIPTEFYTLIDPNTFFSSLSSLVLGRYKDKLILYITGFQEIERRDSYQRELYNSVVYISENFADEAVIQALIVKALQDELSGILNNVVKSSSDGSVEISSHELLHEFKKLNSSAIPGERSPTKTKKLGKLSQERKQQLAKEIAQLKHFPKSKNKLVVVTTISDKKNLEDAGVWRGLSKKISSENEQWEDMSGTGQSSLNNLLEQLKNNIQKFIIQKTTSFLSAFLVCLLLINIWLIFYNITLPATTNKKVDQLKFECQQLEKRKQNLKYENQALEEQIKYKRDKLTQALQTLEKETDKLNQALQTLEKEIDKLN